MIDQSFISIDEISSMLAKTQNVESRHARAILENALSIQHRGLCLEEMAILLQSDDKEIWGLLFEVARQIKNRIYGNRVVLFAPLYVSNFCSNNCLYCAFRGDNKNLIRKKLSHDEIEEEVQVLEQMGHKRLLMVYGESHYDALWIKETIEKAYSVKTPPSGEIRRINVNLAPLDVNDFKIIQSARIGTFQCFQETYHRPTYEEVHLSGKKKDFLYRLYAMHRAMEAGINDVGAGILLGLYDYKFDSLALLKHCHELESNMGIGPHTLSFPRIEPAQDSDLSYRPPYTISDKIFEKIIAVFRIAVPYTGIIVSTRENKKMRSKALEIGATQISAGSRVYPGSYKQEKVSEFTSQQFQIGDLRSLEEVIFDILKNGEHIPSFCTGCYRNGRTGDHFMGLAKSAFIHKYCTPNAILTFAEYLRDYAKEETRKLGMSLIKKMLNTVEGKNDLLRDLNKIKEGKHDLYY